MKALKKSLSVLLSLVMTLSVFAGLAGVLPRAQAFEVGDTIEYGTYPQTQVAETPELAAAAASAIWKSYGYYFGTGNESDGLMEPGDYMRFADFFAGGEKYRAVYFSEYRPYMTGFMSTSPFSNQDENGYSTYTTYYFKYEPVSWRVLDPSSGLVMAESLLDAQAFQNVTYRDSDGKCYQGIDSTVRVTDYAESSIREWLNHDFYETAFSDAQKSNIRNDVAIDYEVWDADESAYFVEETYDKVFLLSAGDICEESYGFNWKWDYHDDARLGEGTDYAKSQGLWFSREDPLGVSPWYLRAVNHNNGVYVISKYGARYASYQDRDVARTDEGIRPAIRLSDLGSDPAVSQRLYSEPADGTEFSCGADLRAVLTVEADGSYKLTIYGSGVMYSYSEEPAPWINFAKRITQVVFDDSCSVTSIGASAFCSCALTGTLTIPGSVQRINTDAFAYFLSSPQLDTVVIEDGVERIGNFAFRNQTALTAITVPASVVEIGDNALYGVPKDIDFFCEYGSYAWDWALGHGFIPSPPGTFSHGSLGIGNNWAISLGDDGLVLTISGTGAIPDYGPVINQGFPPKPWDAYKDLITHVVIEDGITKLGNYMFKGLTALETIVIPGSVNSNNGFSTIPSGVTVICPHNSFACGFAQEAGCTVRSNFTVAVAYGGVGGGNVDLEGEVVTGGGVYDAGDTVHVTAQELADPADPIQFQCRYQFAGWYITRRNGGIPREPILACDEAVYEFPADADITLTAVYTPYDPEPSSYLEVEGFREPIVGETPVMTITLPDGTTVNGALKVKEGNEYVPYDGAAYAEGKEYAVAYILNTSEHYVKIRGQYIRLEQVNEMNRYRKAFSFNFVAHNFTCEVLSGATCTGNGLKYYESADPGYACEFFEEIPATGHVPYLDYERTEATCVLDAIEMYYCSECGAYVETVVTTPALGHTPGEWTPEVPPVSCTEPGTAGHYECTRCHMYLDAELNELSNLTLRIPHNLDVVFENRLNCVGYEFYFDYPYFTALGICADCNKYIVITDEGAQVEVEGDFTDIADFFTINMGHVYENGVCTHCGDTHPPVYDHAEPLNYPETETGWYTDLNFGALNMTAKVGVSAELEPVALLFYNETGELANEALISEWVNSYVDIADLEDFDFVAGSHAHYDENGDGVCDGCGEGQAECAEHTWDGGVVTTPATTASEGEMTYTCTVCGAKRYEAIPKLLAKTTVTAENTASGVKLTWTQDENADGYYVYRKTASTSYKAIRKITSNATLSWEDTTAEPGTKYTYCVKSYRGTERGTYTAKSITCLAAITPTLANGKTGMTLTWTKAEGADGYYVFRKTGTGSYTTLKKIADPDTLTYTDTTAVSGTKYTYGVRAYKSTTKGAYTAKTMTRLSAVTPTLTNTASGITVKWTQVDGASGYYVYRKAGTGSYSLVKKITSGATVSYSDTEIKDNNGTKYTYLVKAYKSTTLSAYTAKATYRLTGVTVSGATNSAAGKVTVKWAKNAKATGYQIQYATNSKFTSAKTVAVTDAATLAKTISSLTVGSTYYVRVRAYKTVSSVKYYSAWSAAKSVKITK